MINKCERTDVHDAENCERCIIDRLQEENDLLRKTIKNLVAVPKLIRSYAIKLGPAIMPKPGYIAALDEVEVRLQAYSQEYVKPQSDTVRCEVLFPHVREIDGKTIMLEPMLTGVIELPNDRQTQLALTKGWLRVAIESNPGDVCCHDDIDDAYEEGNKP